MDYSSSLLLLLACFLTCDPVRSRCPVTSFPDDWRPINVRGSEFCYALDKRRTNVAAARENCWKTFRGYLARFHDAASLEKLAGNLNINTKRVWTDLAQLSIEGVKRWRWSDGSEVASDVLSAEMDATGFTESPLKRPLCGALTDDSKPKFSKWMEAGCSENHEYLCQAPKVLPPTGDCVNVSLQLRGDCYAITSKSSFAKAKKECAEKHRGRLAPLQDREVAVAAVNYIEVQQESIAASDVRIWVDIAWNKDEKVWQYEDGKKVLQFEENWCRGEKSNGDNRSHVVMDQTAQWCWKTRKPEWGAYGLCHVGSLDKIEGKALPVPTMKPSAGHGGDSANGTTAYGKSTTGVNVASGLPVDFKTFLVIVSAVGIVLLIVLIVVCVLCWRKKACCGQKRKEHGTNDGFGTPVSFSFMNPDYATNINASPSTRQATATGTPTTRPPMDPPTSRSPAEPPMPRQLPALPFETESTYATINDGGMSPPTSTLDLLNAPVSQYSALSAATTLPHSRVSTEIDPSLLVPRHYSTRISPHATASRDPVPTPIRDRSMTSFSNASPRFPMSPKYADMSNAGLRNGTSAPQSEPTALQYAELAFGGEDEEGEQFVTTATSTSSERPSTGSITQHRFQQKYPSINGAPAQLSPSSVYENEPLIMSPDSPQFPTGRPRGDSSMRL